MGVVVVWVVGEGVRKDNISIAKEIRGGGGVGFCLNLVESS